MNCTGSVSQRERAVTSGQWLLGGAVGSLIPANFSYRQQLLQISDQLGERDVKRLCYLCKDIVSRVQDEKITEGFELFQILEDLGLLGPDNPTFLSECLRSLGKEKLATSLRRANTPVRMPYTPQSFVSQQLISTFKSKANCYASTMEKLGKARLFPRDVLRVLYTEVYLILKMDLPIELGLPKGVDLDRIVPTTLRDVFSSSAAQRNLACTVLSRDFKEAQKCSTMCHTHYTRFDNALSEIQWNSTVRAKVRQVVSKRKDPQGTEAHKACEYIRQVCVDILGNDQFLYDLDRIKECLHALESIYYCIWQRLPMYQWLVNLLYLAKSSVLDLSKHLPLLLTFLDEHREGIIENYGELSCILGQEVLDNLAPQLHFSKEDYHPKHNPNLPYTMTWQVFLIQLVYLAMGYSIEPSEVGERYTKIFYYGDSHEKLFEKGMKIMAGVGYSMYIQVAELKQTAIEFANTTPYDVPIVELFPT